MPRPTQHCRSELYLAMRVASTQHNEHADCSVQAIAAACGVSYGAAHIALAAAGRKPGKGTRIHQSRQAIEALGFRITALDAMKRHLRFIANYPKAHTRLKDLTSHHPDRFPQVWKDGRAYILYNNTHMWAVVDGVNHDWSRGRALRVKGMWLVEKA